MSIIKEVNKPKSQYNWTLKTEAGETNDHNEIAKLFNEHFINKIEDLKSKIDPDLIEDPLEKMKDHAAKGTERKSFRLSTTSEEEVMKAIKKMKNKKSAGVDGISQEILVQGAPSLKVPLTNIFKKSKKDFHQ